jgi:putative colanic acid biosynthesis acetyltransferase WcaB
VTAHARERRQTFLSVLRADSRANRHDVRVWLIVMLFRVTAYARGDGSRPRVAALPLIVVYKLIVEWVMGIELPLRLHVGPGLRLFHAHGIVVHPTARLGANVVLKHGVTIGHRGDEDTEGPTPTIGDGTVFGPHSQVLGDVTVGAGARIGAGAVVVSDVPPGATAVGIPARVVTHAGGSSA